MLPAAFAGKNAVLFSHGIAFLLQADKLQIFLILSLACHHISRKHAEQRIDNTAKRHKIQNRADGFQRQDIQDTLDRVLENGCDKCGPAQIVIAISALHKVR